MTPPGCSLPGRAREFISADSGALSTGEALNDGPILIFDADGDGINDVLVTKGGVGLAAGSAEYQPKLYLNDGRGFFIA